MRAAESFAIVQPMQQVRLLLHRRGTGQQRIEAGRREAADETPVPASVGEDAAFWVPEPLLDALAQSGGTLFKALRRLRITTMPCQQRQHLAVQRQQAVEADIRLVETSTLRIVLRLVMDRRVVHAG